MKAFHAAGTCTYRIFCRCPMSRSGGLVSTPWSSAAITASSAITPNHSIDRARPATPIDSRSNGTAWLISDLDDVIEREERRDDKDDVERGQQLHPRARVLHRVPRQQR